MILNKKTSVFLVETVSVRPKTRSGHLPLSFNIIHCSNLRLQPDHALANQLTLSEVPVSHCTPGNRRRSGEERQ